MSNRLWALVAGCILGVGVGFGEEKAEDPLAKFGPPKQPVNFSDPANVPVISLHPVSTNVVEGRDASFVVVATGKEPMTYQWWHSDPRTGEPLPVAGATNATLKMKRPEFSANGAYYATIRNAYGNGAQSRQAYLMVIPLTTNSLPSGTKVKAN